MSNNPLNKKLKYHITGAIKRGEATAIEAVVAPKRAAHTPGPWLAATEESITTTSGKCKVFGASSSFFAIIDGITKHDEAQATACLIAACPEMLDQLKEVRKFLMSYMDGDLISYDRAKQDDTWPHLLLRDIERLIAKAEGRES